MVVFLAIFFVIDRLAGMALNYVSTHPRGGMTAHRNYITDHTNEDILVFGSSKARYGYNPQIVTDSTGLTCFNCGEDGSGIILFYAWWKIISHRYHPKVLIYDVHPQYDTLEGDNYECLWRLRRFYGRDDIRPLFDSVEPREKWKMLSMMYRYNSTFTELAADFIHPVNSSTPNGYVPRTGRINPNRPMEKPWYDGVALTFDSLRLACLEKLANEMGPTHLVFVSTPVYFGMNPDTYNPIRELCTKHDLLFLDYVNDPDFLMKPDFFNDRNHLSSTGADAFTRRLIKDLRPTLAQWGITDL